MRRDSYVDFSATYIVCLCVYLNFFLTYFLLSLCILPFLFTSLLVYFLTYLSFQNRPVLFPGRKSYEATKPGFSLC